MAGLIFASVVLGGRFGNSMFGLGAIVLQFPNIVRTASIAANFESQMLLGKYLRSVLHGSVCLLPSPVYALDMRVNFPLYL